MFSREDKTNRNTYMNAVRTEGKLILDRCKAVRELINDDIFEDMSYRYDEPIDVNDDNLSDLESFIQFILSDAWEKEYNEIFDALDEIGASYLIDSDEDELIQFTIIIMYGDYRLFVDIALRSDNRLKILSYYMNTDADIDDIDNELPVEKEENMSWKDIVSIWISELKRIADEGWELFS
jgi:hypothetical protein